MEPAPPPPRPLRHPVVRSILFLLAFVAIQSVAAILVTVFLLALGREPEISGELMLVVFALTAPPLVGAAWLFARFLDRRGLSSLGLRWPEGGTRTAWRQAVLVPLATLILLGAWFFLLEPLPGTDVRLG
ncbi:MAG TPA: hypothetical protein VF756_28260, partial [Thermoanaerobaculia bacterium]